MDEKKNEKVDEELTGVSGGAELAIPCAVCLGTGSRYGITCTACGGTGKKKTVEEDFII